MKISLMNTITKDNRKLEEYSLENDAMSVTVLSYGCTLTGIFLPSFSCSSKVNVLLSYSDLESYIHNPIHCGSTLGPNAGRIAKGRLNIGSRHFQLSQNEGQNNIHGGFHNISYQNASLINKTVNAEMAEITFLAELPDGLDGYPGNRTIAVTYRLTSDNHLCISYKATSDRETYLNLSNHAYFNMSGDFTQNVLGHKLSVNAEEYVENDASHIPMDKRRIIGTPFDFSAPVSMQANLMKYPDNLQTTLAKGYNHAFLRKESLPAASPFLTLEDPVSKRRLELYTDTPCVVVYSGGFIGNTYQINDDNRSAPSCAVALEPQDIPDTPNFVPDSMHTLKPGKTYHRTFTYAFYF